MLKDFFYEDRYRQTAKHESVTQKHLKSVSHRTHTVVYTVCSVPFHGLKHTKHKITILRLLGVKYNK